MRRATPAVVEEIVKAGGTAGVRHRRSRHHRRLARGAAGRGPADPPVRALGLAGPPRDGQPRSPSRRRPGTAWSTPTCARASSSPASSAGACKRRRHQGPHALHHLAARRDAAQHPALRRLQGRADHGGRRSWPARWARRHPRQCAGARRGAGRRLQCGGLQVRRQDPARTPRPARGHGRHGDWRSCPTASPATSPAPRSPSTAASRSTTGSRCPRPEPLASRPLHPHTPPL